MMKNERKGLPFWRDPRFRFGGLSTALLCLFLAVLVVLNLAAGNLEKKYAWRVDCSFNAMTTQSQTTLDVLAQLKHPVHIYALYTRGEEDQPLLELLGRYGAASPLVTWEQTDISLNPGLLTRFRAATSAETSITNNTVVISCEETGRWKVLSTADFYSLSYDHEAGAITYAGLNYESSLTSAINYVAQDTIPRIMILQGHGELDENGTTVLASLLTGNNYDVYYFNLQSSDAALQPDDLLLMLSPVRDLTEAELNAIIAFTTEGGSILFTCDYSDPLDSMPRYASLLRAYGFHPLDGMVIASQEEPGSYYNSNRAYLVPAMQSTEITEDLVEGRDTFLILAGSRAFAMPEDADRYLSVSAVLTSGSKAYLRDLSSGVTTLQQQPGDRTGPFALALQARRITETGSVSRASVLGCSTLLTSPDVYAMTVSQEYILRTVEYLLASTPSNLGIMAKVGIRPRLSAASAQAGSLVLVALPMAIIAVAVVVLGRRRSRRG